MKGLWAGLALIVALFFSKNSDAQVAFTFSESGDIILIFPLPCPIKSVAMDAPDDAVIMEGAMLRRNGEVLHGCWFLEQDSVSAFWISPKTRSIMSTRQPIGVFTLIE